MKQDVGDIEQIRDCFKMEDATRSFKEFKDKYSWSKQSIRNQPAPICQHLGYVGLHLLARPLTVSFISNLLPSVLPIHKIKRKKQMSTLNENLGMPISFTMANSTCWLLSFSKTHSQLNSGIFFKLSPQNPLKLICQNSSWHGRRQAPFTHIQNVLRQPVGYCQPRSPITHWNNK